LAVEVVEVAEELVIPIPHFQMLALAAVVVEAEAVGV